MAIKINCKVDDLLRYRSVAKQNLIPTLIKLRAGNLCHSTSFVIGRVMCDLDKVTFTADHVLTDCSYTQNWRIHAAELLNCSDNASLVKKLKYDWPSSPNITQQLLKMEVILEPLRSFHALLANGSKRWSCHPIAATMPKPRRELPLKKPVVQMPNLIHSYKPGSTTAKVDFRLFSMILAKQPKINEVF